MIIPTEPASIYEHTIVARPNFSNRDLPSSNYWFIIVKGFLIICAIVGSILDVYEKPAPPLLGFSGTT
ncbi:hypothetical protein WJX72_012188 [[Myrmecia] bisecta]|uniref:Uncharacterized protein n=1 Tax=[Myrmecia] bisecta TaxID=41462 RepID=A0AAW1QTW8_9CHLO